MITTAYLGFEAFFALRFIRAVDLLRSVSAWTFSGSSNNSLLLKA